MGRDSKGAERTMCKGQGSGWRDKYLYRSRTDPMTTKCRRVHRHVKSTALNGSINWPWSAAMINLVQALEAKISRLTFRPRIKPDETWVRLPNKDRAVVTVNLEEDGLAAVDRENSQ